MVTRRGTLATPEPARDERRDAPISRANLARWLAVGFALAGLAGWFAYRLSLQSGEPSAAAVLVGGGAACTFLSMYVALCALVSNAR